jgi:hypothetical protein
MESQMLLRHANQLLSVLERVVDIGCAEISKTTLLYWYSQERMTVGIWRDLQEKWQEVLEQTKNPTTIPLLIGDAPGLWVFAWGQGLEIGKNAWFKDVTGMSKRKNDEVLENA